MTELIYREESYRIIGACIEVHRRMGCGFLEPVYQDCLEIELDHQGIRFRSQPKIELTYRDRVIEATYKPDFICFDTIIVEIKALSDFASEHRAQVLNYLHATRLQLGLLVNFGAHPRLQHERFALTKHKRSE
jgi:GxxExxY protein